MGAIAGASSLQKADTVCQMLDRMSHRGLSGSEVFETEGTTLGVSWGKAESRTDKIDQKELKVSVNHSSWQYATAWSKGSSIRLKRDPLGVQPLYYGWGKEGVFYFASEVKALLPITQTIFEVEPGCFFDSGLNQTIRTFSLGVQPKCSEPPEKIAAELKSYLSNAVKSRIRGEEMGSWLSGGLDSSSLAALARPFVKRLYTFAAGLPGAPDLEYARIAADFVHSEHHEIIVSPEEMLAVLPEVICHLESFDALLVRSSIMNYLVARLASNYVPEVFSGEGGDELFAGYAYLKDLPMTQLDQELIDITSRLHNTALQRVDRCSAAHGTVAHVCFLDPEVFEYALRIPIEYKLYNGIEKWILREALEGILPEPVLKRTKAKFWEGSGVGDLLLRHAGEMVSDHDFEAQRILTNGWHLNSKEELLYYRFFRERFGDIDELNWIGRSKGAPGSQTY